MLIQTAERAWARRNHEQGSYWPHDALNWWWRCAKRVPRARGARELLALRMLDHWRWHATFRLVGSLNPRDLLGFLENTGGAEYARLLDRLSVAPLTALSVWRLLRANYAGALFQVYRTDLATASISPNAARVADIDALLTHCAGQSGNVQVVYDQGLNAYNFTANAAGNRPLIVNAGTLQTTTGRGAPTMVFNGTASTLFFSTVQTLGLTGTPPRAVAVAAKVDSPGYYIGNIGHGNTDKGWRFGVGITSANECFMDLSPGTDRVFFTGQDGYTRERGYIFTGGATAHAGSVRQDGQALSGHSIAGNNDSFVVQAGTTRWGAVTQTSNSAAGYMAGRSGMLMHFSVVGDLSAGDTALVENELGYHL